MERTDPRTRQATGPDDARDVRLPIVVLAAANRWSEERMADRQLAVALAEHARVLYVDPCSSVVARGRERGLRGALDGQRLTGLEDPVTRLRPEGLPGLSHPRVAAVNRRLLAAQIHRAVRRMGGDLAAVIDANPLTPSLDLVRAPVSIYWAQDDYLGMATLLGLDEGLIRSAEHTATSAADLVIAANPTVADRLRGEGHEVHLVPFGCDDALFRSASATVPSPEIGLPRPVAVLMGTLNDRVDPALLAAVADTGMSIVVIGPRSSRFDSPRLDAVLSLPNVQWLGAREFRTLPALLAGADVGLVPYTHSRFNEGSFPLKTLEYLSAGLPVVATDLPAIRWIDSYDVHIADDPRAFADAVRRVSTPRTDEQVAARQATAAEHSWARRADAFASLAGLGSPAR